ncbi:MAG TPA: hypothetical protein VK469_10205, partial [Candidatus Kapabacteria bacterium]|nr:hypothetical protein [Candidatus Kapabacteria bacterium]
KGCSLQGKGHAPQYKGHAPKRNVLAPKRKAPTLHVSSKLTLITTAPACFCTLHSWIIRTLLKKQRVQLSPPVNPPSNIVFDDQKPFRKKVSGLPKAFVY